MKMMRRIAPLFEVTPAPTY